MPFLLKVKFIFFYGKYFLLLRNTSVFYINFICFVILLYHETFFDKKTTSCQKSLIAYHEISLVLEFSLEEAEPIAMVAFCCTL